MYDWNMKSLKRTISEKTKIKKASVSVFRKCAETHRSCVVSTWSLLQGLPRLQPQKVFRVSQCVHVCVFVCVKRKLGKYYRNICCVNSKTLSLTHGHFNNKRTKRHCLASVWLTDIVNHHLSTWGIQTKPKWNIH